MYAAGYGTHQHDYVLDGWQDIAAWTFLALVIILSNEGDPLNVLYIALSTAAFIVIMLAVVRVLLDKCLVYTLKYAHGRMHVYE